MPWLVDTNPDIDWKLKTVRPRDRLSALAFHPCVPVQPARCIAGQRRGSTRRADQSDDEALLNYYYLHGHHSDVGTTRLVRPRHLRRLLRECDNEFCFFVNPIDEPSKADLAWEKLKTSPAYPLVIKFRDKVFRSHLPAVPPTRQAGTDAKIELEDDVPIHRKQFPVSAEQREAIRAWTAEMLAAKMIRPSTSPYCASTFCVKKRTGEWRIVHDFRGLNTKIRVPANPIPRKDDILRAMANGKLFSAMDLLWGFFQVKLVEESVPFTAFATPDGLFEYLVTPMGISSSPSSFNRLVQAVFSDLQSCCQMYFDDLFVFTSSDSTDDHLVALEKVLTRCAEQHLYIKIEKCTFCATEIPCLGDFVGKDGIRMDPSKIQVIKEWPTPRTKQELQSFLGTCVYVMKYCDGFGDLMAPITELTKGKSRRDPITFGEKEQHAFDELKRKLASPPVLAHPDFSKPFHVRMDASDFAIGGYLFQYDDSGRERIIAFNGRKLSRAELIYPTREKELLAAQHAMRVWKVYLIDRPFFINTDHRTIEGILQQQTCSQRLARWLNELALFQPQFKWVPGATNVVADTISRNPSWNDGTSRAVSLSALLKSLTGPEPTDEEALFAHSTSTPIDISAECSRLYPSDKYFGPIWSSLTANSTRPRKYQRFELLDGLLFFRIRPGAPTRVCVPADTALINTIMHEEHDTPTRGHPGQAKTQLLVASKYYWPGMVKSIRSYVETCELCQRNKYIRCKPTGHLHPLEVPEQRWTDISMDFMTNLPQTDTGFVAIFVIVDRLTKRAHFLPTKSNATTRETAKLFRDFYQRLHGLPMSIVSDRDAKFTSSLWKNIMDLQSTRLNLSTAFKPSTDGQSEVTNKVLSEYLRHFVNPHQSDWDELLPLAEFAYNSRNHESIGMSPFMADLGYEPRSVADCVIPRPTPKQGQATSFLEHQQTILGQARDAIAAAQANWQRNYDKNRPHTTYSVGDDVLLNTRNLELDHVGTDGARKFAARFIGPYRVTSITGPDRYKLDLPPGLRLFPEFHVSMLRPYHHDASASRINRVQPVLTADGAVGHLVAAITKHRRRHGNTQYFVRWQDSTVSPSWEPVQNLSQVIGLIRRYLDTLPKTRATARLREEL
ncbi:Transposon Ty3-G Gag-Pol polyprotein [Phytophthora rubi]|uniref:Transposon Ty3-G Gag-Pol polyprotein n=1 Tax=Phytophthora rubi TaxID=129364 RepID=A0A6A4C712_9STRA|nr:Transposon Ty3-G Gag-Pol polyprotein [Phytophthora rubi]